MTILITGAVKIVLIIFIVSICEIDLVSSSDMGTQTDEG